MQANEFNSNYFPTWCPGCGSHSIWSGLKETFVALNWSPDSFVMVYDIGCSGNMADFVKSYGFHALHGRAIPLAVGLHLANPNLPAICIAGDGGAYGEGLNHLIHACRGNFDIKVVVHNNGLYGLTTGQASPTSGKGFKSKSTPQGIIETPLNPLALAISQGASFVGQGFSGDLDHLKQILLSAFKHRGFSLINVLQPCVTFNKVNTFQWYRERVYHLEESSARSKTEAISLAMAEDKIPLGIIYQDERETYESLVPQLKDGALTDKPLEVDVGKFLEEFS